MTSHQLSHATTARHVTYTRKPGLFSWLLRFDRRFRHSQMLRHMTDTQLADIGLTRAQADAEAERLVWDAPIQFRARG